MIYKKGIALIKIQTRLPFKSGLCFEIKKIVFNKDQNIPP